MRRLLIGALLLTPAPAWGSAPALGVSALQQAQVGAFAGFRLRLPLGGAIRERRVRAVLTVAPTLQSLDFEGNVHARTGEGIEFGFRSNDQLSLAFGGEALERYRLKAARNADGKDGGIPTWALVIGGAAAAAGIGYLVLLDQIGNCDRNEDCN